MKKLLVLLAMCVLAAGCGDRQSGLIPGELFDPAFAYVVANYAGYIDNASWHNYNGQTDQFNVISYQSDKDAPYTVHKVRPGNYFLRLVNVGKLSASSLGPLQLASFSAEAGKINYIGDIGIKIPSIYNMKLFELSTEKRVDDAKTALRKNYPWLSVVLDKVFVYSPAVMGGLKK